MGGEGTTSFTCPVSWVPTGALDGPPNDDADRGESEGVVGIGSQPATRPHDTRTTHVGHADTGHSR